MDVDVSRIHMLIKALNDQAQDQPLVSQVIKNSGLKQEDIAPPATVYSAHGEALFVRYACDALDDITFGARSGLLFSSSSSLTAYISKYSRDLRQAMENAGRFHKFIDPAIVFSLRVSGNFASLEADWKDPSFARYHRRTEFLMFAALARMRTLTQSKIYPIEIRFQHEIGHHEAIYQKIDGFPVVFGAEKMEIVLPLSALDIGIPTYDPSLRAHLLDYGERLLAESQSTKNMVRAQVEGLITRSMPGHVIPAEEAAAHLGMSPRTLTRRLQSEGTGYREVVEDLRCDLAQTFIKNGMTLSEISYSLGYADQAAFSNAFKRWTGQAPSTFKKRVTHPIGVSKR